MTHKTEDVPILQAVVPHAVTKINETTLVIEDIDAIMERGHLISSSAEGLGVQRMAILFKINGGFYVTEIIQSIMPRRIMPAGGHSFLASRVQGISKTIVSWEYV